MHPESDSAHNHNKEFRIYKGLDIFIDNNFSCAAKVLRPMSLRP